MSENGCPPGRGPWEESPLKCVPLRTRVLFHSDIDGLHVASEFDDHECYSQCVWVGFRVLRPEEFKY